jgi:inosine-uridine nucleoside N-ribohydrolase
MASLARTLCFLTFFYSCAGLAQARIPVILSTDTGNEIDDQWVVAHILTHPDLEVLGVISVHAPSLPPPAGRSAYLVILDEVENRMKMRTHPPIFEGASLPLADSITPLPNAGVDFIIESSRRFSKSNRLDVLAIGAGTDVASAILKDPTIVDRIRVFGMAFKSWADGGEEYNVLNDVKAWQVILQSDVPVVVGCGDVARANLALSLDQARELVSTHGPIGHWLWKEFEAWYWRQIKPLRKDDFSKPWIIWDEVSMAFLLGMTTQEVYPRPVLRDDLKFDHPKTEKTITWVTDVDEKRLWADFLERIDTYQRTHDVGVVETQIFLLQ